MVTPFSPEQLAWLEAKFSGPTPPHSSAGSGDPTGTGTAVAGSSEDAPTDAGLLEGGASVPRFIGGSSVPRLVGGWGLAVASPLLT